jgi:DNA-binding transcriptional LysR family regulator
LNLETTHLNTLIAVANAGSYSKAAEELGITQSAVSQNLKRLEQRVGVPLFVKSAKSTGLTPEGEKLVELTRGFFAQTENFLDHVKHSQHEISGALRVGTLMGIGKSWVAPKMLEFSKIYPALEIKVVMDFPDDLVSQFEAQKLDALILTKESVPAFVDAIHLEDEKTTLIFPKFYPMPKINDLTLKDLLAFPIISFQDKDPLFLNWAKVRFGSLPKLTFKPRLVINSFSHILKAVSEGLGIAVIPTHVIDHYQHLKDNIETFGPQFEVAHTSLFFIMQQGATTHHKIKTLLDYFKKEHL